VRLRLWHAADGTRVAYREAGAGPALVLLHYLIAYDDPVGLARELIAFCG